MKMLVLVIGFLMLCGCSKGKDMKKDEGGMTAFEEKITQIATQAEDEDKRVLAMAGSPNEEGFYSIDLPRSAEDLPYLDEINNRLYSVAGAMVAQDSKEPCNDKVILNSVALDAVFDKGDKAPFKESSDGKFTEITLTDLKEYIKNSFNSQGNIYMTDMPEGCEIVEDKLRITYGKVKGNTYGFVMSDYKQVENKWHIKGEIMTSGAGVFSKGEYVLEQIDVNGQRTYKIIEFKEE